MDTVNNGQMIVSENPRMTVYDAVIKQLRQTEVYTLPNTNGQFGKVRLVTQDVKGKRGIVLVHEPNASGIQPLNSQLVPTDGGSMSDNDFVVFEFTRISYEFGDKFKGGKVLDFKIWAEVADRQYVGIRSLAIDAVEAGDVIGLRLEGNQYRAEPEGVIGDELLDLARKFIHVFVKRVITRVPAQDARTKYIASANIDSPYIKYMMQENRLVYVQGKGLIRVNASERKNNNEVKRANLLSAPATPAEVSAF